MNRAGDSLNFSEPGWWGRIFSEMKVLVPILIGLLIVGCGKKAGVKDIDNEKMKQAMQWDADIKILKLEVEHLKADLKRLQEDNNPSSARTTPPMKNIVGSYVGRYEKKGEKIDCKFVFYENGKGECWEGDKKHEGTWKIVGNEVHVVGERFSTFIRIETNDDLTCIGEAGYGKPRKHFSKDQQMTLKKQK